MKAASGLQCPWQVAFALEVILGDLGDDRFADGGRQIEASQSYTREVARILADRTGRPWKAVRHATTRMGYGVLAKPGMTTTDFSHDCQVAGVILQTPPLPLEAAETLRRELQEICTSLDGSLDRSSGMNRRLAWNLEISCEDSLAPIHIDPVRLATFVNENALLSASGRTGLRGAGLQRHIFGPGLLRDLSADPQLFDADVNLEDLIRGNCKSSMSAAARFPHRDLACLRHYGVNDFLSKASLADLVTPILASFETTTKSTHRGLKHLLSVFRLLKEWLAEIQDGIDLKMGGLSGFSFAREGTIHYGGMEVGRAVWQGTLELELYPSADLFCHPVRIHGQRLSDARECITLLCLDAIEVLEATGTMPLQGGPLFEAAIDLRGRLARGRLLGVPAPGN